MADQHRNLEKEQIPAGIIINPLPYDKDQLGFSYQSGDKNLPKHDPAPHFRGLPTSNYSNFPEDFVTQFSPVEEEPVGGQKHNDFEEINPNFDQSGFQDLEAKGSSKEHPHHSVHFSPTSLIDYVTAKPDSMPRKSHGGHNKEDEEMPYNRTGPLLVGEKPPSSKIVEEVAKPSPPFKLPEPVPVSMNRESDLPELSGFEQFAKVAPHKECCMATGETDDSDWSCYRERFSDFLTQNPQVQDLVYWRDWKKSAAVFVPAFILLVSLTFFPFLLVIAYLGLFLLAVNLALKLLVGIKAYFGKNQQQLLADVSVASQKCEECRYEKAVRTYLSGADLKLDQSRASDNAQQAVGVVNRWMQKLQDVILVKDLFASLKGALVMWLVSLLGSVLSPAAIILLAFVATFTLPKFYETYKQPIDKKVGEAVAKYKKVEDVVQQKYNQVAKRQPAAPQQQHKKAE